MRVYVYAISKNEEKHARRWMASMTEADGVYVLDTGSTDDTTTILRELGAHVSEERIEPWRFDTARNRSMELLPEDADIVLVHDGARALVTDEVIEAALRSAEEKGSGVAAVPVTDTIKKADESGLVTETQNRAELYAMQTPQAFRVELLRRAHAQADAAGYDATDDAVLLEYAGMPVYLTRGHKENLKLTTPEAEYSD